MLSKNQNLNPKKLNEGADSRNVAYGYEGKKNLTGVWPPSAKHP